MTEEQVALRNVAPYILSKLTQFVGNPLIRPIISQPRSTLDFAAAMSQGRACLINLAKGVVGEYDAGNSLRHQTVWLGDTPVAVLKKDPGGQLQTYAIHADHLNTPRAIVDGQNRVVWRWLGSAFGQGLPEKTRTAMASPSNTTCASPASITTGILGCITTTSARPMMR